MDFLLIHYTLRNNPKASVWNFCVNFVWNVFCGYCHLRPHNKKFIFTQNICNYFYSINALQQLTFYYVWSRNCCWPVKCFLIFILFFTEQKNYYTICGTIWKTQRHHLTIIQLFFHLKQYCVGNMIITHRHIHFKHTCIIFWNALNNCDEEMVVRSLKSAYFLPEKELSCFLVDDLVSCLKEFSSSASPSPHQEGCPYRGVPRGSAVTSPRTNAHMQTQFNKVLHTVQILQFYGSLSDFRCLLCALHSHTVDINCLLCDVATNEPSCSSCMCVFVY